MDAGARRTTTTAFSWPPPSPTARPCKTVDALDALLFLVVSTGFERVSNDGIFRLAAAWR